MCSKVILLKYPRPIAPASAELLNRQRMGLKDQKMFNIIKIRNVREYFLRPQQRPTPAAGKKKKTTGSNKQTKVA